MITTEESVTAQVADTVAYNCRKFKEWTINQNISHCLFIHSPAEVRKQPGCPHLFLAIPTRLHRGLFIRFSLRQPELAKRVAVLPYLSDYEYSVCDTPNYKEAIEATQHYLRYRAPMTCDGCGGIRIVRNGFDDSGKQRWRCANCRAYV